VGTYPDNNSFQVHSYLLSNGKFVSFDVLGAVFTEAIGINSRGDIVGDYVDNQSGEHGFLLSDGTFTPIDLPGASATAATGINDQGDIVGWFTDSHGEHGFLLRKESRSDKESDKEED
jgi:probable HAF family extracellular repeat protein